MTIQTIPFTTEKAWLEARTRDVTSTEVSALFDSCPYLTAFELWHRKAGRLTTNFDPTERTIWGTRLQAAIAAGVADDEHWAYRPMTEYMRDTELRAGSSFDYEIEGVAADGLTAAAGLLEVKNVDDRIHRDTWLKGRDDETGAEFIEAPVHIELQVQHQLMVSGRSFAYIAALVGGNRIVLTRREPDPDIISALRGRIQDFWASIDSGQPPAIDFARDADVVIRLNQTSDGTVIDAPEDAVKLAIEHRMLGEQEKAIKERRESLKAEILTLIGPAAKATFKGGSISASVVAGATYTVERKPYRGMRIYLSKAKGE